MSVGLSGVGVGVGSGVGSGFGSGGFHSSGFGNGGYQEYHFEGGDDMGDILKAYQQADILVLATPVYFYGISAQMKTFIDRTYPIWQNLGHKDVYYIDGCSQEECLVLLERYGELLINDGMNRFGFGCHESQDEIMLDKYNVVTIYSQQLSNYNNFFEAHGIEKVESLITAWDTFSDATPGQSERCDCKGKSVYDLPEELKDWGMYLADTRAE